MCLWVSYKEKIWFFLHPYSHWRKESDPELDSDPEIRFRIRTKMSRIPNTDFMYFGKAVEFEQREGLLGKGRGDMVSSKFVSGVTIGKEFWDEEI